MKLKQYITEGKKLTNPMIGYGVDRTTINPMIAHIKSWLVRYDIQFDLPKEYHLTVAQIIGTYDKDELVRITNELDIDYSLTPVGIKLFKGLRTPNDYLILEYTPHHEFVQSVKKVSDILNTYKFNKITPHISLFIVKQNSITDDLMEDLRFHMPKPKRIKPTEVQIWNSNREIEYSL